MVSHAELATGGVDAGRVLAARLGLAWSDAMTDELTREASGAALAGAQLHNFDRAPATVAQEWRARLGDGELDAVEDVADRTLARLESARLVLS